MSLELVAPDASSKDEEDTRLGERLEKLGTLVECLKEDLLDAAGSLEALLDYLGIDRLEFEFFRQTGRLHAYPSRTAIVLREAEQTMRHHDSAEEELAKREKTINEAVKQLDEVIAGIVEINPDYESC